MDSYNPQVRKPQILFRLEARMEGYRGIDFDNKKTTHKLLETEL